MSWIEVMGFVSGALIITSLVPQIVRVFRLKSAQEISLLFTVLMLVGTIGWLIYGVSLQLKPVMVWNAIGTVFTSILIYAKMKYGR